MTSSELRYYIQVRGGELTADEVLDVIDISRHPQVDHFSFENGVYQMWDREGNYFTFRRKN